MGRNEIMKYLELLELDNETKIDEEMIQRNFRKLSFMYHPDRAAEEYKDGKRFVELQEARKYLISNIKSANNILSKKTFNATYSYYEEKTSEDLEKERIQKEIKTKLKKEILENVDKNLYRQREYRFIISFVNEYVNEYINEFKGSINYQAEYETIMSEIKKVKTKKYYVTKKIFRTISIICVTCFLALVFILFLASIFIGPLI